MEKLHHLFLIQKTTIDGYFFGRLFAPVWYPTIISLYSINPDPNELIFFGILLTGNKSLQHFSIYLAEIYIMQCCRWL